MPTVYERVRQLMKLHGIKARGKRKFVVTTDSKHDLPIAPNLLDSNFRPDAPHNVWTSDITYIQTDEGWLNLAVVLDLYSRQVVGWSMQAHMQTSLVTDALRMAVAQKVAGGWADIAFGSWQPVLQSGISADAG